MKKLFLILAVFLVPVVGAAADVSLAWNHSGDRDGFGLFYRDFQHEYGDPNIVSPLWEGPDLACTVTVPDDRLTAFQVRAYKWGLYDLQGNRIRNWSSASNEAVFTPELPPPPAPPSNLIVKILVALLKAISGFFV